jgi:hypothetical protein
VDRLLVHRDNQPGSIIGNVLDRDPRIVDSPTDSGLTDINSIAHESDTRRFQTGSQAPGRFSRTVTRSCIMGH